MSVVLGPVQALTEAELDRWIAALAAQRLSAPAPGEEPDGAFVRRTVRESVLADGGVLDTITVRRDGRPTAAARLYECLHPLTLRPDLRLDGLCDLTPGKDGQPGQRGGGDLRGHRGKGDRRSSDQRGGADQGGDGEAAATLIAGLPAGLAVRAELPVRGTAAPLTDVLVAAGFQPEVLTIRRATGGLPPVDGWRVRPATPADAGFVRSCLAAAVRNGLAGETVAVDLDAWIAARFAEPLHPGAVCVVAERDGRPVGHGYATVGTDRYGPVPAATVHDVFVLPEAKGGGGAHAITAALGEALLARGVPMMEGEVIMKGGTQPALRAGLSRAGWREDRMRWHRP